MGIRWSVGVSREGWGVFGGSEWSVANGEGWGVFAGEGHGFAGEKEKQAGAHPAQPENIKSQVKSFF